jgi:4-hydroxy-tetrahydrodipicolinate synthase
MFEGVIPILQSAFHDDGALDLDSIRAQVDFAIDSGADALAYPGFVSEWWKLSGEETIAALRAIVERNRGRVPVIANVTAQSTYLAIAEARAFRDLGCSGLMCLPPFVVPRSSRALIAHLRAVLAAVSLPHVLQYSASLTGIRMEAAQLAALRSEFPHFCSIKVDFIPPGPVVSELREELGEGFTYLIGFAGLRLDDCLARGAHGLMGGTGHTPEDVRAFRALHAGDHGAVFRQLLPLLNFEMQTIDQSIATHKWLLKHRGVIASPHVRQPGPVLDSIGQAELRAHLDRITVPRAEDLR